MFIFAFIVCSLLIQSKNAEAVNNDTVSLETIEGELAYLRRAVKDLNEKLKDADQSIEFFARMEIDVDLPYHYNRDLPFTNVTLNVGNAYRLAAGLPLFRAPVRGLYFFALTLTVNPRDDLEVSVNCKNVQLGSLLFYENKQSTLVKKTETIIVHLHLIDEVYLRIEQGHESVIYGGDSSSFSGFLFRAD